MSYPIRVRPTALIIENEQLLLIEYSDHIGVHYNLPGGGAEQGETLIEGVIREVYEEFECRLKEGSIPKMPEQVDFQQSEVKWIAIKELENIVLYPNMVKQI